MSGEKTFSILFIDDNKAFIEALIESIEVEINSSGITLQKDIATCLHAAKKKIIDAETIKESGGKIYDLILIDWSLRRASSDLENSDSCGEEVVELIKNRLRGIDYILLTVYDDEISTQSYISKNKPEEIINYVRQIIVKVLHNG